MSRPRRGVLRLGPSGRALRADPPELLSTIASTIASVGASAEFDLVLAQLLMSNEREVDFRLLHLLGPFHGVIGGRFRQGGT